MGRAQAAVAIAALTAACSTGLFYDPVFLSVGTPRASNVDCPEGSTCVEVPVTALGEAAGRTGRCELYTTPGDPAVMDPLVAEALRVPAADADAAEIAFLWEVRIPQVVQPGGLNPVCAPMIEG